MADNKFGLGKVKTNIELMKAELPRVLANQAQNFFVKSFQNQGWEGQQWKEPQRRIKGTPEYKYPKFKGLSRRTKPTLTMTGRLRRETSNSIRSQVFNNIRLVVALAYATAHNDGDEKKNLPKRTFMKHSPTLGLMQREKIKEYVDRLWRI